MESEIVNILEYDEKEYKQLIENYKTNLIPNLINLDDVFIEKWGIKLKFFDVNGLLNVKIF